MTAQPKKQISIELVKPPAPPWMEEVEARLTRYASREEWLKARASGIGGSEAAIIMGASSWGSPYQLWAEKTGLVPPDDFDNEVLRFGRVVEPLIAKEYEQLTGRRLIELGDWAIRRHATRPYMFCTHDRLIEPPAGRERPGVLSIKSANVWRGVEWLEGEEPPLAYQVQWQHELACSGFDWGSFAVLIWGKGVRWVDQERNDGFIAALEEECRLFWERVESGQAPAVDGSEHTTEALRRLYPHEKGDAVVLPAEAADWATEIAACEVELKRFGDRKDALRNMVRAAIGEAPEGYVPGGPAWTYRTQKRSESVIPAGETRVLRRKGPKKGAK